MSHEMGEIIAYFGKSHVDYLLADATLIRLNNARTDAWMANNLAAYDLYNRLLKIVAA